MNTLAFTFFFQWHRVIPWFQKFTTFEIRGLIFPVNVLPPPLPAILPEFSPQPSNLNLLVTALVIYHCITTYYHKTRCFKITINFYHLTVSVGQRLKPSSVKGMGQLLQLCCSKRGKAGGGWESVAHSNSEIQWDTGNSWLEFKAWFYPLGSWFCFLSHPFSSIKGSSHLKLHVFSACFLPAEVQGSKDCFSFVLSLSLSVQADSVSANSILFKRKKKREKRKKIFVDFLWILLWFNPLWDKGHTQKPLRDKLLCF